MMKLALLTSGLGAVAATTFSDAVALGIGDEYGWSTVEDAAASLPVCGSEYITLAVSGDFEFGLEALQDDLDACVSKCSTDLVTDCTEVDDSDEALFIIDCLIPETTTGPIVTNAPAITTAARIRQRNLFQIIRRNGRKLAANYGPLCALTVTTTATPTTTVTTTTTSAGATITTVPTTTTDGGGGSTTTGGVSGVTTTTQPSTTTTQPSTTTATADVGGGNTTADVGGRTTMADVGGGTTTDDVGGGTTTADVGGETTTANVGEQTTTDEVVEETTTAITTDGTSAVLSSCVLVSAVALTLFN